MSGRREHKAIRFQSAVVLAAHDCCNGRAFDHGSTRSYSNSVNLHCTSRFNSQFSLMRGEENFNTANLHRSARRTGPRPVCRWCPVDRCNLFFRVRSTETYSNIALQASFFLRERRERLLCSLSSNISNSIIIFRTGGSSELHDTLFQ